MAARGVVHLRRRHPVRRGRPAARDSLDDVRRRRDRSADHGFRRHPQSTHGGIFVFFAIGNLLWFLVALVAGTVVGAVAVVAAKQFAKPAVSTRDAPELVTT